ncbi:MAG: adenylate kinase [Thermoplasmata archaeon]|jgi:adenylate kinase|nr:adenylate kinase [Thermoplasmata archaeon]
MRVALTGTPGVGKTTVAAEAARHGWAVVDLKAWARAVGAVAGHDPTDQADAIDVALLRRQRRGLPADCLVEGHLSHLLGLDAAWVLRCDPAVLRGRLQLRGYGPAKVHENLEAEALDLILQEALDATPRVVQRDGTRRNAAEVFAAFADVRLDALKAPDLEPVDWSGQLPIR